MAAITPYTELKVSWKREGSPNILMPFRSWETTSRPEVHESKVGILIDEALTQRNAIFDVLLKRCPIALKDCIVFKNEAKQVYDFYKRENNRYMLHKCKWGSCKDKDTFIMVPVYFEDGKPKLDKNKKPVKE